MPLQDGDIFQWCHPLFKYLDKIYIVVQILDFITLKELIHDYIQHYSIFTICLKHFLAAILNYKLDTLPVTRLLQETYRWEFCYVSDTIQDLRDNWYNEIIIIVEEMSFITEYTNTMNISSSRKHFLNLFRCSNHTFLKKILLRL